MIIQTIIKTIEDYEKIRKNQMNIRRNILILFLLKVLARVICMCLICFEFIVIVVLCAILPNLCHPTKMTSLTIRVRAHTSVVENSNR